VAYLDRTQAADLGECIERVEGVLAERIRLFTSLQADLIAASKPTMPAEATEAGA